MVLAAGASRRLGQPKQLICVGGETLLARTIRVTQEAGADPICVVLGAYAENILQNLPPSNLHVILNEAWEQGIATSIHAGVRWLEKHVPTTEGVLLLVCDQPRLTAQHVGVLLARFDGCKSSCCIASTYAGVRGVPAILPKSEFAKLLALQGDQGARSLLQHPGCDLVSFESGAVDIDTPADLSSINGGFSESP